MTPNDIEVLLHCHVSPVIHPRYDEPAVKETIENFCSRGILEPYGDHLTVFQTTARGQALVLMLCQTPLPEQVFIDPRTESRVEERP